MAKGDSGTASDNNYQNSAQPMQRRFGMNPNQSSMMGRPQFTNTNQMGMGGPIGGFGQGPVNYIPNSGQPNPYHMNNPSHSPGGYNPFHPDLNYQGMNQGFLQGDQMSGGIAPSQPPQLLGGPNQQGSGVSFGGGPTQMGGGPQFLGGNNQQGSNTQFLGGNQQAMGNGISAGLMGNSIAPQDAQSLIRQLMMGQNTYR